MDALNLGTTSGDCAFSGDLTGTGNVGTVSGDIDIAVPDAGVEASSLGEITWNGRDQGPSFHRAGDGPALTVDDYKNGGGSTPATATVVRTLEENVGWRCTICG